MSSNKLYSKENCQWCHAVKELLRSKHVPYEEVDVSTPDNLAELKALVPDVRTVPQFFFDGEHIGGYAETRMFLADTYGGHGEDVT